MNDELTALLDQERRYAWEARAADEGEAAAARAAGDVPRAFDLSTCLSLAEVSWALEDWSEARRWYSHNADTLAEARVWHRENSGSDYPLAATLDWEAASMVKAGRVDEARDRLADAVAYRREQPGSELVVAHLSLHAAQVGLADLAALVDIVVAARQDTVLVGGHAGREVQVVSAQLHYEPVQARLLLGDWSGFRSALERLEEAVHLVDGAPGRVYAEEVERATVAAARGFRVISGLEARSLDPAVGGQDAREAFEDAMLAFYRGAGWATAELYFMRLNVLMADQLARGEPLNPNPFAAPG